jgi:nicotinamidase-related amidase
MADVAGLPHVARDDLVAMLPPARTALVVDVQTDFAAPFGLLGRVGADLSRIEDTIDRIDRMITVARHAGATVAFMRVVTRPETDPKALKTLMARKGTPGGEAICRNDDGGADYYRVQPRAGDIEIEKLLFNSFHDTDLDDQLRAHGIDTLVMTGFSTDCCVDATARDAFHRDYNVFVVSDGCDAYDQDLHAHTLNVLHKNCALLVDASSVEAAWS